MYEEGLETEYKLAEGGLPNDLWETYSAFANTVGGVIILGIKEQNHDFFVEGIKNPSTMIDDFWNTITNKEKVSQNILSDSDVYVDKIENKQAVAIKNS